MIEGRTKADFRARREMVGMKQADVANALGVRLFTVKRWEREGDPEPPDDAWELIERREGLQNAEVTDLVDAIRDGEAVELVYFRTENEARAMGFDEPIGILNANAREAAIILDSLGNKVTFRYPG